MHEIRLNQRPPQHSLSSHFSLFGDSLPLPWVAYSPSAPRGPAHSPSPDLTSGQASTTPARDLPGSAPPPPSLQLPPPSLLADKPGQTAGQACPRSRASSAKPRRAGGPGRCQFPTSEQSSLISCPGQGSVRALQESSTRAPGSAACLSLLQLWALESYSICVPVLSGCAPLFFFGCSVIFQPG